jgi:hypothetical protein
MFDLKESDLPELERLADGGYKWIARELKRRTICVYWKTEPLSPNQFGLAWGLQK